MVCARLHLLLPEVLLEYADVVAPSPACRRALQTVVSLLEQDGHEVTAMSVFPTWPMLSLALIYLFLEHSDPPSPLRALQIGSQLMANACKPPP